MQFRAKQIAPPKEWGTFEDLCHALFKRVWNDPLAQKNGRSGQEQHGVDVFGSRNGDRPSYRGVQCKGKDCNYGSKAKLSEIISELAKAEKFRPTLEHWIFATTAPVDGVLQKAARELSADRTSKGLFAVDVLGWQEIQALMADHPEIIAEFYPEHADHLSDVVKAFQSLIPTETSPARPKPSNLPGSIQHLFKGREEFLERLRESFRHKAATAITGKAVHGLGGVGKTRTAIEYGHAHAADYSATFFLTGKSESDLKDSLAALAADTVLDLPENDVPDLDARVAAVIRWLRTNPGWLLIIDNVDDPAAARAARAFLDQVSRAGGHIVITSRLSDWGHMVEPLDLDLLSVEAAKELLRESTPHRTKRADEDAALTRLADEQLGCLSLALVQAAAYIETQHIGFAEYSERFERETAKLLDRLDESAKDNLGYPLSVAATWQASFAQLSDAGRLLLDMLAWLSIEPIPRDLFDVWPEAETVDLDEALAGLSRYSLVHWEAENRAITLHRLVAQVTRDNLDDAVRDRVLGALFSWVSAVNFNLPADDIRYWPRLLPLLPHVLQLFERTNTYGPYADQIRVYNEYAILLRSLARYSEAEPLYRRALALGEALLGEDHPIVRGLLNNLATFLLHTNQPTEAEPLYRRALAMDEARNGPNSPEAAILLNNLAELLQNTDRLVEAESLSRRALSIDEANLARDHPNVAIRLNNLAAVLRKTNRLDEAEPLYRRALAIDEANLGPDHPSVAIRLNNLAGLLRATDRLAEAEPLYRRAALILLQSSKASCHLLPNAAPVLRNYASALIKAGREPDNVGALIASLMTEAGFDPAELWPQIFGDDD